MTKHTNFALKYFNICKTQDFIILRHFLLLNIKSVKNDENSCKIYSPGGTYDF